jgi:hypothetical protein
VECMEEERNAGRRSLVRKHRLHNSTYYIPPTYFDDYNAIIRDYSFIRLLVCLAIGPKPLPR